MTAPEALERMEALANVRDLEEAHVEADNVLCAFLRYLGCNDLVDAYERIDKWYA